jgi:hypothetical protein
MSNWYTTESPPRSTTGKGVGEAVAVAAGVAVGVGEGMRVGVGSGVSLGTAVGMGVGAETVAGSSDAHADSAIVRHTPATRENHGWRLNSIIGDSLS